MVGSVHNKTGVSSGADYNGSLSLKSTNFFAVVLSVYINIDMKTR